LDLFEDSSVRRALLRLNVDVEKIKSDKEKRWFFAVFNIT